MSVKKGKSGRYHARIYSHGQQVAMATFDKENEALGWESTQRSALYLGGWSNPRNADVPLGDVIAAFNNERDGAVSKHTYDTDSANLRNHVTGQMKKRPIGALRPANFNTLYAAMMKTHARPTVLRLRDSLVSVCKFAVENGILTSNIAKDSKVPKGTGQDVPPDRPLSEAQLVGLIAAAHAISPTYAQLIEFLSLTGLRWGEAVEARVSDVRLSPRPEIRISRSKSNGYQVKGTKSGRARTVPLTRRARELVDAQAAGKAGEDLLFPGARGGHLNSGYFTRKLDWSTIAYGHRIHDLRHTAATNWIRKGVSIKTVSIWLGHSSSAITHRVYSGYIPEDNDVVALARLEQFEADTERS